LLEGVAQAGVLQEEVTIGIVLPGEEC